MGWFETIPYKVIEQDGKIGIRHYEQFLLATTRSSMNERMDSGFNQVFDYIAGGNQDRQKISMTTPVVTYQDQQSLITGFYVPSKVAKARVPQPISPDIYLQKMYQGYYAVIQFSGNWKKPNILKHVAILQKYLIEHGIRILGPQLLFRYQPPFVPGIFRRNEIHFPIEYHA